MKPVLALAFVLGLGVIGYVVGPFAKTLFFVVLPYVALSVFVLGIIYRVACVWGRAPAPFSIGTTCGQQRSLPWIRSATVDNPSSRLAVLARMLLEVVLFRSLLRNTRSYVVPGPRIVVRSEWLLWVLAMVFHLSLFVTVVRHLRFVFDPVPSIVLLVLRFDGFLDISTPTLYVSGIGLLLGACSLLVRRLLDHRLRIVSLPSDYFPLFLLIAIAGTGVCMRYFTAVDVTAVREVFVGLARLRPSVPESISPLVSMHLFLVCFLIAYLPWSKLAHAAGVFLSPTRNLRCDSRAFRHANPWNHGVRTRTYAEYESEYRDKLIAANLPIEGDAGTTEGGNRGR